MPERERLAFGVHLLWRDFGNFPFNKVDTLEQIFERHPDIFCMTWVKHEFRNSGSKFKIFLVVDKRSSITLWKLFLKKLCNMDSTEPASYNHNIKFRHT